MTRAEVFKENIKLEIKIKEGMINRAVDSIKSCIDNDPVSFADQILSNAEELSELKKEIGNLRSMLNLLAAIEESE